MHDTSSTIDHLLSSALTAAKREPGGEPIDYIPMLAAADPEQFGIAYAGVHGGSAAVGDADVLFSVQSISKAFVFGLAVEDLGVDAVLARVGTDPSPHSYRDFTLNEAGLPANPMINVGALVTTSLIRSRGGAAPIERIRAFMSAFAGRELAVDAPLVADELATADHNRGLASRLQSIGALDADPEQTLVVYCEQCAIMATAVDLASMAATLAGGGVNPASGERAASAESTQAMLGLMAICGMYDATPKWMAEVGLAAKSGVGGGIIAVAPGAFGVAAFSPRLDEGGTSVRARHAIEQIAAALR